jgi:hypothetical protein
MRKFSLDKDTAIESADLNYMVARRYFLLSYHLEDVYEVRSKQLERHVDTVGKQRLASVN